MAAQYYYNEGQYTQCQQILLSVAVNYVINSEQYVLLALSYLKARQFKQASSVLQYVINNKLTSKETQSKAVCLLVQSYIQQQKIQEAYDLVNKYTLQNEDIQKFAVICYKISQYKLTKNDYDVIQNGQQQYWQQLKTFLFSQRDDLFINEQSQPIQDIAKIFESQKDIYLYIRYLQLQVPKITLSAIMHDISLFYYKNNQLEKAKYYNNLILELIYNKDQLTNENIEILLTNAFYNNNYKLAQEIVARTYKVKINSAYRNHMESIAIDLLRKNNQQFIYMLLRSKKFEEQAPLLTLRNFALCVEYGFSDQDISDKNKKQKFVDSLSKAQYQFMRFYQYNQQLNQIIKNEKENKKDNKNNQQNDDQQKNTNKNEKMLSKEYLINKSFGLLKKQTSNQHDRVLLGVILENCRLLKELQINFSQEQEQVIQQLQDSINY